MLKSIAFFIKFFNIDYSSFSIGSKKPDFFKIGSKALKIKETKITDTIALKKVVNALNFANTEAAF